MVLQNKFNLRYLAPSQFEQILFFERIVVRRRLEIDEMKHIEDIKFEDKMIKPDKICMCIHKNNKNNKNHPKIT